MLTDKDIKRAEAVAPTLNETPESFKAKIKAVRNTIKEGIETWKSTNAGAATPSQIEAADEALAQLGGKAPGSSKPATESTAAKPAAAAKDLSPDAVNKLLQSRLEKYNAGGYDNDPALKARIAAILQAKGKLK